jgi:hypothetical protein
MDTIGSLVDKLSILEIRKDHTQDPESIRILNETSERLKNEINEIISKVLRGQISDEWAIRQPKLKNYAHQDNQIEKSEGLAKAIQNLIQANIQLWNIEDTRRDKSLADHVRLAAADQISVWNKKRNDAMDNIDVEIWKLVEPKKNKKA